MKSIKKEDFISDLLYAGIKNKTQHVKVLIEGGADIAVRDEKGFTLLHIAAKRRHIDLLKYLIPVYAKAGLLDAQTYQGDTACMFALRWCTEDILESFIAAGVSVTIKNNKGFNVLHTAAAYGQSLLVMRLLSLYSNAGILNAQTQENNTVLMLALAEKCDDECIEALINAGVAVTQANIYGFTPLHEASQRGRDRWVLYLIPLYIKAHLLNAQTDRFDVAFTLAAGKGRCEVATINAFISAGVDLKYVNGYGNNALMEAVFWNNFPVVQHLVPFYAKERLLNEKNNVKMTALTLAVYHGCDLACVKLLILAGADIKDAADQWGWNPLHYASSRAKQVAVLEYLIPLYAQEKLLDATTLEGETPLMLAGERFTFDKNIFDSLINAGADLFATDKKGFNILHRAVYSPSTRHGYKGSVFVKYLLPFFVKKGVLNAQTKEGATALILAAAGYDDLVVKDLVGAGADITIPDKRGYTALHSAAEIGSVYTLQYLIPLYVKSGLLNTYTAAGQTALDIALKKNHKACINELRQAGAQNAASVS